MENKKSYFYIDIKVPEEHQENPFYLQRLKNSLDLRIFQMEE